MSKENFKKINKDYVLSDSSTNVYNYRLLTAGYQIAEYLKNPIGYHNHYDEDGVLIRWYDVRIDGDVVKGKPMVNLSHPRGERTVSEAENGFLNGASMGKFVVLECHYEANPLDADDPILVVTKWYNKECSLVDAPGNRNAFAVDLMDGDLNPLDLKALSDDFKNSIPNMSKLVITPRLAAILPNLSDTPTQEAFEAAIQSLADTAAKVPGLETDKTTLTQERDTAQKDLKDLQDATANEDVTNQLKVALQKGQLTKALHDKFSVQYKGKPMELKDVLEVMPAYKSVVEDLEDDSEEGKLRKMTWDELHKSGKLPALKDSNPVLFKELMDKHKKK
jgi:hypothetical protein